MGKLQKVIAALESKGSTIGGLKALTGFDGYVDHLAKVVNHRRDSRTYTLFQDIREFAQHLYAAACKSCDLELLPQSIKLGGNAPIMANALGCLGVDTVCIGALGEREIAPPFREMSPNCRLISIGEPSQTTALEFGDGKVMLADSSVLATINWECLKDKVGVETLRKLIGSANLVALVNWSLLDNVETIWWGILEEVLPGGAVPEYVFFDLADPAKRSSQAVRDVVQLMGAYSAYTHTILGLNENEAERVYAALYGDAPQGMVLGEICLKIREAAGIDTVVIHPLTFSVAVGPQGTAEEQGFFVPQPKISTGGGDNFNAGFCLGMMLGLNLDECLVLAMGVSSFYVRHGFSPTVDCVISCLRELMKGT